MAEKIKKEEIAGRVIQIIADQIGVEDYEVKKDSLLVRDLDIDSLDVVEMFMTLEDIEDSGIGVSIPDEIAQGFKTVEDIIKYIEEHF